jgi:spore coat protein U-like protein
MIRPEGLPLIVYGVDMNKLIRSAAAAAILAGAGSAMAATATTNFNVTATVVASCSVSASNLAFGSYTPSATDFDVTGANNIGVSCTNGTAFNVGLSAGLASGATVTNRRMVSGGNELAYQLFRDAGFTNNWGTTIGTDTASGSGSGMSTPVNFTVYGRIPGATGQAATPAAGYTDTITVTVTY